MLRATPLLAVIAALPSSLTAHPYFPLNTHTLQWDFVLGSGQSFIWTALGGADFGGTSARLIQMGPVATPVRIYLSQNGDHLAFLGWEELSSFGDVLEARWVYDPPYQMLTPPLQAGTIWQFDSELKKIVDGEVVSTEPVSASFEIRGFSEVTVGAGTFMAMEVVEVGPLPRSGGSASPFARITPLLDPANASANSSGYTYWYGPDAGWVRIHDNVAGEVYLELRNLWGRVPTTPSSWSRLKAGYGESN
jgi:hypothetical protein